MLLPDPDLKKGLIEFPNGRFKLINKASYLIINICLPRVIIWRSSRIYNNLFVDTTIH